MTITFTKFIGDRESKACDILADGVRVGSIERINTDDFQTAASRARTMRFASVEVYFVDGGEAEFLAADGYTSRTATKAAKEWAIAQAGK